MNFPLDMKVILQTVVSEIREVEMQFTGSKGKVYSLWFDVEIERKVIQSAYIQNFAENYILFFNFSTEEQNQFIEKVKAAVTNDLFKLT